MKCFFSFLLFVISISSSAQDDPLRTDWANLKKYRAENEVVKDPLPDEQRVVFMGNSITEGWKVHLPGFFAHTAYLNRGIGGQTTAQMLVRFRPDVIALKPVVVVILAGINDIAENMGPYNEENTLGNIVSMVELAKANHIIPVLCSMLPAYDFPWRKGLKPAEKVEKLNELLKAYALKNSLIYVDYYTPMVDGRKGLDKQYTDDEVHPKAAGYKVMVPIIEEALARALKK